MRLQSLPVIKLIVLVVACECIVTYTSGQITIGKIITDRKLSWTDFEGKPVASSPFSASTYWSVNYHARVDSFHADTAFLSFQVTPVFNSYLSWVKKDCIKKRKASEALLCHEQGHYNIAIACAETLKQTMRNNVFLKSDYSIKADSLADAVITFFTTLEDMYDAETNHMLNRYEQMKWNERIAGLLKKEPAVYTLKEIRQTH